MVTLELGPGAASVALLCLGLRRVLPAASGNLMLEGRAQGA